MLVVYLKGKINGEFGCVFSSVFKRVSELSFFLVEVDEVLYVLIEVVVFYVVIWILL